MDLSKNCLSTRITVWVLKLHLEQGKYEVIVDKAKIAALVLGVNL